MLVELGKELRPWVPVVAWSRASSRGHQHADEPDRRRGAARASGGILAGPNIIKEVAEGYAAAAVLAMPDQNLAPTWQDVPHQAIPHLQPPMTSWGEMAGALKNVYAIAVGMGYSLGIGENTRAMVMARAVREMSKLGGRSA